MDDDWWINKSGVAALRGIHRTGQLDDDGLPELGWYGTKVETLTAGSIIGAMLDRIGFADLDKREQTAIVAVMTDGAKPSKGPRYGASSLDTVVDDDDDRGPEGLRRWRRSLRHWKAEGQCAGDLCYCRVEPARRPTGIRTDIPMIPPSSLEPTSIPVRPALWQGWDQ